MTFRKATEQDIASICHIFSDTHTLEEAGLTTIGWKRNIYPTVKTAEAALLRNDLFVAEDEGKVVGTAIINQIQVEEYKNGNWKFPANNDEIMVLHTLVISPKEAKKGYGRGFVSFYEEYACSHGCSYLRMDTNEKNQTARSLYKKLGYEEIGIVPCNFNELGEIRLVLLEKFIG